MKRWDQEYQEQVRKGLSIDGGVDPLSHCALGLAGETGEVCDLIKKSQYKGNTLDGRACWNLRYELGDTLWYLTAVAGHFGWELGSLAVDNVLKLSARRGGSYDAVALYNSLRSTRP